MSYMKYRELQELSKKYQSALTQYGPNNQATLRAEVAYREAKCARTACDRPHQECVHRDTGRKYCASCARAINDGYDDNPLVIFPGRQKAADDALNNAKENGHDFSTTDPVEAAKDLQRFDSEFEDEKLEAIVPLVKNWQKAYLPPVK